MRFPIGALVLCALPGAACGTEDPVAPDVLERVVSDLELDLAAAGGAGATSPSELEDIYYDLMLYLLLTGPPQENEPELDSSLRRLLVAAIEDRDDDLTAADVRPAIEQAATNPDARPRRASEPVAHARAVMARVPTELTLVRLQRFCRGPPLTLDDLLERDVEYLFVEDGSTIRRLFTRRCYEDHIRGPLGSNDPPIPHAWVTGELPDARDAERMNLRSTYFRAYDAEWERLIRNIRWRSVSDAEGRRRMFGEMVRGDPPLLPALYARVRDETSARELMDAFAGFSGVASPSERGGAVSDMMFYEEQVEYVHDALELAMNDQLETRLTTARTVAHAIVEEQPPRWRSVHAALLLAPLEARESEGMGPRGR